VHGPNTLFKTICFVVVSGTTRKSISTHLKFVKYEYMNETHTISYVNILATNIFYNINFIKNVLIETLHFLIQNSCHISV
jgi:hypothetical protein